ncbi:hypothetical protein B0H34DRAFT_697244 [Crassisporium funariophilum]|nr:hypothetical protein B0H34DRAFT_697244 [Crassisporium funariophilum]
MNLDISGQLLAEGNGHACSKIGHCQKEAQSVCQNFLNTRRSATSRVLMIGRGKRHSN